MPIPSCKLSTSMKECRIAVVVVFKYEEKVPQGRHAGESPLLPNISLCSVPFSFIKLLVEGTCVAHGDVLDNNLELTSGLQKNAMSLGPKGSDTHRATLTSDTGDLIQDTSRQK
ncbi:hypothetical protein CK203_039335 [Vitis vinifera]|uniref:Uncharacterized protein n=1 Tax=Vitis vinifera TaxID=29760 RepID=A0A438HGK8_VITVI|nr:hypothetical protein CK203_039335 [Vitis vinifera]